MSAYGGKAMAGQGNNTDVSLPKVVKRSQGVGRNLKRRQGSKLALGGGNPKQKRGDKAPQPS